MWDARTGTVRTLLGAGLAASLLVGGTWTPAPLLAEEPVEAGEDTPGFAFFEDQVKNLGKTAADKLWKLAKDANKRKFFQHAREEAQQALTFDTNHKKAREFLAWNRRLK